MKINEERICALCKSLISGMAAEQIAAEQDLNAVAVKLRIAGYAVRVRYDCGA